MGGRGEERGVVRGEERGVVRGRREEGEEKSGEKG
jgi:hypothetical protein